MEKSYWLSKWQKRDIGFHKNEFHPLLVQEYSQFSKPEHKTVLVPLCGKSLDLMYFLQKGFMVTGVEFSGEAIKEFFSEQELTFTQDKNRYESNSGIILIEGDFFSMEEAPYDLIYDRAALIALSLDQRISYWDKIKKLLKPQGLYFLITLEHDQIQTEKPPHTVLPGVVSDYWGNENVKILSKNSIQPPPKFSTLPQEGWKEVAYLITPS